MSPSKAPTPRVIFIRHGQTEWSKSGQYTSITDLPLTDFGVKQMRNTGKHLIGPSPFQLIKPENLKNVFTSPRLRAKQTVELLLEGLNDMAKAKLLTTEEDNLREWEYGDYEGLLTSQIIELRNKRGLIRIYLKVKNGTFGGTGVKTVKRTSKFPQDWTRLSRTSELSTKRRFKIMFLAMS